MNGIVSGNQRIGKSGRIKNSDVVNVKDDMVFRWKKIISLTFWSFWGDHITLSIHDIVSSFYVLTMHCGILKQFKHHPIPLTIDFLISFHHIPYFCSDVLDKNETVSLFIVYWN